jgi:hypothetical protein
MSQPWRLITQTSATLSPLGYRRLIGKQALSVANRQLYRFHDVFACISGIILMGTPHSSQDGNEALDSAMLILRAYVKLASRSAKSHLADDPEILKELALRFGDVRLRVPILSVYETKDTKFRENAFRTRKIIVSLDGLFLQDSTSHHRHLAGLEVCVYNQYSFGRDGRTGKRSWRLVSPTYRGRQHCARSWRIRPEGNEKCTKGRRRQS